MAEIITGQGVNIFDKSYSGGDSTKIVSVADSRLLVDGSGVIQPVIINDPSSGVVTSYGNSSSVATNSTAIVTYYNVSVGTTFYLKSIIASASAGPVKVTVEYAATSGGASAGTYAIGFFSSANPTLVLPFYQPIVITGPLYIRVSMKNDNPNAQDLYATIIGLTN